MTTPDLLNRIANRFVNVSGELRRYAEVVKYQAHHPEQSGQVPFLAPPDDYIESHLREVEERKRAGTGVEHDERRCTALTLPNLAQAMRKAVDPASVRTVVERTAPAMWKTDPLEYAPHVDGLVRWFTFGQSHVHQVGGFTYDCDVVVCIIALDPRAVMVNTFGRKWASEYDTLPDMRLYPRGVKMIVAVGYPCLAFPVAGDLERRRSGTAEAVDSLELDPYVPWKDGTGDS